MNNNERICDVCGKNAATVHYRKTINGKTTEKYMCQECAAKIEAGELSKPNGFFDGFGGFDNLFGKLFFNTPFIGNATKQKTCPTCGFTLDDIRDNSRLGCSECYEFFADDLNISSPFPNGYTGRRPALERADGKPVKTSENKEEKKTSEKADELTELRARLQKALAEENYELCAKLRDEIKNKGGDK